MWVQSDLKCVIFIEGQESRFDLEGGMKKKQVVYFLWIWALICNYWNVQLWHCEISQSLQLHYEKQAALWNYVWYIPYGC
jgi:hypothetical protein